MRQVMLTGEPSLVSMSAALLEAMLEHNSASLATLYQTGVFFFALAYCGSNLVEIGRFFKVDLCIDLYDLSCCVPSQESSPRPGTGCYLILLPGTLSQEGQTSLGPRSLTECIR